MKKLLCKLFGHKWRHLSVTFNEKACRLGSCSRCFEWEPWSGPSRPEEARALWAKPPSNSTRYVLGVDLTDESQGPNPLGPRQPSAEDMNREILNREGGK